MNMSYCRFENTFSDLKDCLNAIEENDIESNSEKKYAEKMRDLCKRYISAYEDWECYHNNDNYDEED